MGFQANPRVSQAILEATLGVSRAGHSCTEARELSKVTPVEHTGGQGRNSGLGCRGDPPS